MARGRRTRVARNIYQDSAGFSILVQRGKRRPELRFPPGTPLDELRVSRDALIDDLETGIRPNPARGSLGADVVRALATLPEGSAYRRDARTLLDHWLGAALEIDDEMTTFGAQPRHLLQPLQIRTQLAVFRAARKASGAPRFAPKTLKELLRLLGWVYATIDGPDARNPVRAVKAPRVTYDDPRGIDYDVIARIFAAMPDRGRPQDGPQVPAGRRQFTTQRPPVSLSKIRLRVMAYTGMHQIEIGRLEPRHVDLVRQRIWIGPRVKGAGSEGAWHGLVTPAIAALRDFVAAKAFGPFDTRGLARAWKTALGKAKATWETEETTKGMPWPVRADARPYDLRHSLGTLAWLSTGDIGAAQEILRHKQLSTTMRYTRAGVSQRAALTRTALDAALVPHDRATDAGQDGSQGPPMGPPCDPPPRPRRTRR